MPVARLLVLVRDAEEQALGKVPGGELQPNRQAGAVEPAGDRKRGQAGERRRDGEHVAEVHLHRVLGARAEGFGAEVKGRILVGTYVLSHGYYDAYYLQAQKIRRLVAQDFALAFEKCDVIMGPTAPTTAWSPGASGILGGCTPRNR